MAQEFQVTGSGPLFLDYDLPAASIAQEPVSPRDSSRLLVIRRATGSLSHHHFRDLPDLLNPGDLVVLNTTRVLPARLFGTRESTGGRWHALFVKELSGGIWEMLGHSGGHIGSGEWLGVESGPLRLRLRLAGRTDKGRWLVEPHPPGDAAEWLGRCGHVPLPPYIRKGVANPGDLARYQTLHAQKPGSIAAPTAGLHFTPEVHARLKARGIGAAEICLHVGPGTFQPLPRENPMGHEVEPEWGQVSGPAFKALRECRSGGGRVVTVGTTSTRLLESMGNAAGLPDWEGWANITLRPGHQFQWADALITNFHQPGTGLLLMMNAIMPPELVRRAYVGALEAGYRFLSYGDACLVL